MATLSGVNLEESLARCCGATASALLLTTISRSHHVHLETASPLLPLPRNSVVTCEAVGSLLIGVIYHGVCVCASLSVDGLVHRRGRYVASIYSCRCSRTRYECRGSTIVTLTFTQRKRTTYKYVLLSSIVLKLSPFVCPCYPSVGVCCCEAVRRQYPAVYNTAFSRHPDHQSCS